MLKMRNEKGVTLTALSVTIIVLMILLSITVNLGVDSINSTKDRKLQAELEMVQQACISEYTKAKELGYLKSSGIPENYVGEKISASSLPSLTTGLSWVYDSSSEPSEDYKKYYRLTKDDLTSMNILNSEHTYIVNYYTGEVYNETKRVTSEGVSLYIQSVESHQTEDKTDTSSFVYNTVWGN